MQGKPAVTQLLNDLLHLELTAVHQYLLHAEVLGTGGTSGSTTRSPTR